MRTVYNKGLVTVLAAAMLFGTMPAVTSADDLLSGLEISGHSEELVGIGITQKTTGENRDLIMVGDSREVLMHCALFGGLETKVFASDSTGDLWSAKGGATYDWMVSEGVPQVESSIGSGTAVVIEMGVNDVISGPDVASDKYAAYINEKAAEWTARGAAVCFCSVMPVYEAKTAITNAGVDKFNTYMKQKLNSDVQFLDMSQYMASTIEAIKCDPDMTDRTGVHFSNEVLFDWYNVIQDFAGGGNVYDPGTAEEQYQQLLKTYEPVYNYDFYVNRYSDLRSAFGSNKHSALKHFINHGMDEARKACETFDPLIYRANYPDLEEAYGDDYFNYYQDYIIEGMKNGRNGATLIEEPEEESEEAESDGKQTEDQSGEETEDQSAKSKGVTVCNGVDYSAVYDWSFYIADNADVKAAFGNDDEAALKHFVTNGMKEGRHASSEFNVKIYRENYSDLQKAFGSDREKYFMHFIKCGKAEGRNAVSLISGESDESASKTEDSRSSVSDESASTADESRGSESETSAADAGDADEVTWTAVYQGVDYSAVYNWDYYINKYSDLKAAFGNDDEAALKHFVKNGMKEARQASGSFNLKAYKNRYADLRAAFGSDNKAYYVHYIEHGKSEGRIAV